MPPGIRYDNLKKINDGRPRFRWEDDIKTDFREIGWKGQEWINLAQDND
jgi:hypothetical protein